MGNHVGILRQRHKRRAIPIAVGHLVTVPECIVVVTVVVNPGTHGHTIIVHGITTMLIEVIQISCPGIVVSRVDGQVAGVDGVGGCSDQRTVGGCLITISGLQGHSV